MLLGNSVLPVIKQTSLEREVSSSSFPVVFISLSSSFTSQVTQLSFSVINDTLVGGLE